MRIAGSFAFASICLAAGCGKVQPATDAAPPIDATEIDGIATGGVTVTTRTRCCTNPDQALANVDIIVNAPDGTVRDTYRTDANGSVTVDVTAGDSITAVYFDVGGAELITFGGVEPGDTIGFGERFTDEDYEQTGTMTATFPNIGASQYQVEHPCGTGRGYQADSSATLYEYSYCMQSPMDLLFVARDDSSNITGWGLLQDVAFSDGGTVALSAWQNPTSFTLSTSGLPPFVEDVGLRAQPMLNGQALEGASTDGTPVNGSISRTFPWATGGDGIQAYAYFSRSGGFGFQQVLQILPANATQTAFADPIQLPWVSEVIGSAAARQMTWILDGEGTYDLTAMQMRWRRYPPDGGVESYTWTFLMPPGIERIDFPELPAALASRGPRDDDNLFNISGGLLDFESTDGWDELRARPEWDILYLEDAEGGFRLSFTPFGNERNAPPDDPRRRTILDRFAPHQ